MGIDETGRNCPSRKGNQMGSRPNQRLYFMISPVRDYLTFGDRDRITLRMPEDSPVV
jgi:hypothetical protein